MLYWYIRLTFSMNNGMYKNMLEPTCWVCFKVYTQVVSRTYGFFVWTYLGLKHTRQGLLKRPMLRIKD